MKNNVIIALALLAACSEAKNVHQAPDPELISQLSSDADADSACPGGVCDDVDGNAEFCAKEEICHRFTGGFRLPTTLPNGQKSCPPGFDLKKLDAPNTSQVDACDAANAFAWPLLCEIGCYGDVDLDPPVNPVINGGCCEYTYHRDCQKEPACAEPAPVSTQG